MSDFLPRDRQRKLLDTLFPFFHDIAIQRNGDDLVALRVCRHLRALRDQALSDPLIAEYIDIWNSQHPEEDPLLNSELQWGLLLLDKHLSKQFHAQEVELARQLSPRAKLRVINGGLSENPDIPYIPLADATYRF